MKEKIKKIEKEKQEKDPEQYEEQKKKEQELQDKLRSLSPYSQQNARSPLITNHGKKVLDAYSRPHKRSSKQAKLHDCDEIEKQACLPKTPKVTSSSKLEFKKKGDRREKKET